MRIKIVADTVWVDGHEMARLLAGPPNAAREAFKRTLEHPDTERRYAFASEPRNRNG